MRNLLVTQPGQIKAHQKPSRRAPQLAEASIAEASTSVVMERRQSRFSPEAPKPRERMRDGPGFPFAIVWHDPAKSPLSASAIPAFAKNARDCPESISTGWGYPTMAVMSTTLGGAYLSYITFVSTNLGHIVVKRRNYAIPRFPLLA